MFYSIELQVKISMELSRMTALMIINLKLGEKGSRLNFLLLHSCLHGKQDYKCINTENPSLLISVP